MKYGKPILADTNEMQTTCDLGMLPGHADDNPKTQYGEKKPSLGLIPKVALEAMAAAHQLGADKYGPWNWRDNSVAASVYINAMMRHIQEWKEVADNDPDTQASHLGNVMACCAILLDAQANDCLIDDRPVKK